MKSKLSTILILAVFLVTVPASAAIWIVDNTDVSELYFTTMQAGEQVATRKVMQVR